MQSVFRTEGLHGYAVEFSPYNALRLGAVVCQQFGIQGHARLVVVDVDPGSGACALVTASDWSDALFDLTWSEARPDVVVAGGGDGSVIVWDFAVGTVPVLVWKEHAKEVYGVDWSTTRDVQLILSASWDGSIKLWDVQHSAGSLATFSGHERVVYSAIWAPLVAACFASTSGDETLRIWDTRKPHMSQIVIPAHTAAEVLSCDWCKYDQNILASGATDGSIRVWDLRNTRQCLRELRGHTYAVRRVKFSPFSAHHIVSSSYDFTVRVWNWQSTGSALEETIEHHTEFVYGLDCSSLTQGQIADCSWDQTIKVYRPRSLQQTV